MKEEIECIVVCLSRSRDPVAFVCLRKAMSPVCRTKTCERSQGESWKGRWLMRLSACVLCVCLKWMCLLL